MLRRFSLLVALALCVASCAFVIKLFTGTVTVSEKFAQANTNVRSEVLFGGDFMAQAPRAPYQLPNRSADREPPPILAAQPSPTPTLVEPMSTFSIDVDTASYTHARKIIGRGWLPDPETVRVEEFLNYFHYDYVRPPTNRTASVSFEGAPSPFATDGKTHLLRIGLQARGLRERVPVHVTFLVDTSGSMRRPDRLPLVKQVIRAALSRLDPTDRVAIATYAGSSELVLDSTPVSNGPSITTAIAGLHAAGGTAMGSGMELAYGVAVRHAGPGRVSRVFVMSDGDANIGRTSASGILGDVRSHADEGVTLSTVGFGTGRYNDALMERLADAGNGNYTYIDNADEIPRAFVHGFDSLLHVVAKDVKIQVEFDADAVMSWRQIGYENRRLANGQFRDDRVDAGELGAGHQVTAMYEVTLRRGLRRAAPLAKVRFRYKGPDEHRAQEVVSTMLASSLRSRIGHASADFRFQAAVATFAERLRGDDHQSFGWIEEVASSAVDSRAERRRFVELVRKTAVLHARM